jgi:hypothetical protein
MICAGRGLPHALHFVDVICIFDCFGSETVMARKARTRWSFAEDRRLIQLAASLKSLEAVAAELKRTPESVVRTAKKLGVSLKSGAGLKGKK